MSANTAGIERRGNGLSEFGRDPYKFLHMWGWGQTEKWRIERWEILREMIPSLPPRPEEASLEFMAGIFVATAGMMKYDMVRILRPDIAEILEPVRREWAARSAARRAYTDRLCGLLESGRIKIDDYDRIRSGEARLEDFEKTA